MTKNLTDSEVFQLAGYAHGKLAPLFAELKEIEPSIYPQFELRFPDAESVFATLDGIQVSVHWAREGMFLSSDSLRSGAAIDALAEEVKADIEKLKTEALVAA